MTCLHWEIQHRPQMKKLQSNKEFSFKSFSLVLFHDSNTLLHLLMVTPSQPPLLPQTCSASPPFSPFSNTAATAHGASVKPSPHNPLQDARNICVPLQVQTPRLPDPENRTYASLALPGPHLHARRAAPTESPPPRPLHPSRGPAAPGARPLLRTPTLHPWPDFSTPLPSHRGASRPSPPAPARLDQPSLAR